MQNEQLEQQPCVNVRSAEHIAKCEKAVLSHFFTSITDDVYAVTDAMPMSLWGFVAGLASRTHLSVRDRFLQVLRDTLGDEYIDVIVDIQQRSTQRYGAGFVWTPVLEKASKFLKTWAVNYGHASLKDSCVDRIVVDRCSIRAAKILEESSLGAFQEKSTRYCDFSTAKEIIPDIDVSLEADASQIIAESNTIYNDMLSMCEDFYKRQLDPADFVNEAALVRTARAKAFDTARYCLLTSKPTALAFTMPSRETERHLSSLLAHPNQEMQEIARKALEAAMKINPGLLTHVESNDAQHDQALGLAW
jgi:thymidylate synthase ThyX